MPNHCGNRLTIIGDFDARSNFVNEVKPVLGEHEEPLDFSRVLFPPENVNNWEDPNACSNDIAKMFGIFDGRKRWNLEHWGTKWNAYEVDVKHDEKDTVFTFLTAWTPPGDKLMDAFAKKFPDVKLDLRYVERGFGFYGYWVSDVKKNGDPYKKWEYWEFQNDDIVTTKNGGTYLRPGLEMYLELYRMSG